MKPARSNRPKPARPGKAPRPGVAFCAGSLFFTHITEWPEGVEGAELAGLAELALEEISPFALESLAWGFTADEKSRTLFLFAACLPRIDNAEHELWQRASHVFPAFLPLVAQRGTNAEAALPARELLVNGGEVLLLERDPATPWPRRIRSERVDAGAVASATEGSDAESGEGAATQPPRAAAEAGLHFDTSTADGAACAVAVRLLVRCGAAADAAQALSELGKIPFWRLQAATDDRRGEVHFRLVAVGEQVSAGTDNHHTGDAAAQLHTKLEGEDICWSADLRSAAFIVQARKRHRSDVVQWRVLCGAVAGALALLLVWLSFWGLGFMLGARQQKLAAQEPAVARIRQDQDLLTRMRQFSADPFSPFGLIAGLKTGKPAAIYFDTVELQRPAEITVDGQGPTVDAVNAYTSALVQSGRFSDTRQARISLRDGVSVFTLYLQYLGEENASAVQASQAPEAAADPAQRADRASRLAARRTALAEDPGRRTEIAQGIPDEEALAERIAALRARVAAQREAANTVPVVGEESRINEVEALEEPEPLDMPPPPGENGFDDDLSPPPPEL